MFWSGIVDGQDTCLRENAGQKRASSEDGEKKTEGTQMENVEPSAKRPRPDEQMPEMQ